MRILFVENKHVTRTWEALVPRLQAEGDDIHWLIQNPLWAPRVGALHQIPWPLAKDLVPSNEVRFEKVSNRDRGINYFGGNNLHYTYYAEQILNIIKKVRPDVIFGEATLFHELISIDLARSLGIPYLFPTSIRYPTDRIGFHAYDTQEVICGSGDILPDTRIEEHLEIYARRGSVPMFYSNIGKSGPVTWLYREARNASKNLTASISRLRGEKFNTPPILHKLQLDYRQRALMKEWDEIALQKTGVSGQTTVLFPLQMLPESTLDTWGYVSRDQNSVLEEMVLASDDDTIFQVKTNPVPRYEVNRRLIDFVRTHPRVRPLPSSTKMDDVFWHADVIATITGSVAIECLLAGKPFVTTVRSLATDFAPEETLIVPGAIGSVVDRIRQGRWNAGAKADRRAFLTHQIAIGHQAVIADYYHFPAVLDPANLDFLAQAYAHVRQRVDSGRLMDEVAMADARAVADKPFA